MKISSKIPASCYDAKIACKDSRTYTPGIMGEVLSVKELRNTWGLMKTDVLWYVVWAGNWDGKKFIRYVIDKSMNAPEEELEYKKK